MSDQIYIALEILIKRLKIFILRPVYVSLGSFLTIRKITVVFIDTSSFYKENIVYNFRKVFLFEWVKMLGKIPWKMDLFREICFPRYF